MKFFPSGRHLSKATFSHILPLMRTSSEGFMSPVLLVCPAILLKLSSEELVVVARQLTTDPTSSYSERELVELLTITKCVLMIE